jgi:YVTN family beta-propeller protein
LLTPSLPANPQVLAPYLLDAPPAPGLAAEDVVLLGERVYVCNRASDNVSVVADGRVTAVVTVGRSPSALAAHAASARVFVLNEMDGAISVLAGDTVQETWTPEIPPSTVAVVGDELWIGSQRGDRVLVLDARDGQRVGEVALSGASAVYNLAPHVASGRVYAATYGRVHAIDVRTLTELARIELASYRTLGVSPDGERLYVGVWSAETQRAALQVLEAASLRPLDSVELDGDTSDLLADPRDGRLFVLASYPDALWVIDPLTLAATQWPGLGLRASAATLSDDGARLYVCHRESDNLVIVDTATLAVSATVPLSLRVNDLAVKAASGAIYAAVGPADRVYRLEEEQPARSWSVEGYPYRVSALPDAGLATLSRVGGRLCLLDADGAERLRLEVGDYPGDLALELAADTLYAGGTVLSLTSLSTATLSVPTLYGSQEIPRQIVRDTRRERLYAVAFNGVPGSNGGSVVTRLGPQGAELDAPAPGRLSVIDLLYDEDSDRFFSTNGRMGTFGLQVSDGEDCRELLYLPLAGHPVALALDSATHHLWLALQSSDVADGRTVTELIAWDTRSLGEAARLRIDGAVSSIAVDEARMRVYLGSADTGQVHVVQDVPLPQPPSPTATQTSTP